MKRALVVALLVLASCGGASTTSPATVAIELATTVTEVRPPSTSPASVAGRFDLPPKGEAAAVLTNDGEPLWIVRHRDGTVSAFEAVVQVPPEFPNGGSPIGFSMLVVWSPSAQGFVAPLGWDEWGRAAWGIDLDGAPSEAPRSRDLVQRQVAVMGNEVLVGADSVPLVDGDPNIPPPSTGYTVERPMLPTLTDLPHLLGDGWVHVNATLVRQNEVYRVCTGDYSFSVGDPQPCPDTAPLAPISGGPSIPPDAVVWFGGPLLIHVSNSRIVELVPLGGTAGGTMPTVPATSLPAHP